MGGAGTCSMILLWLFHNAFLSANLLSAGRDLIAYQLRGGLAVATTLSHPSPLLKPRKEIKGSGG